MKTTSSGWFALGFLRVKIKGIFSKTDANSSPLTTIMDKSDQLVGADDSLLRPLPLIGHLSNRVQMSLLLGTMIVPAALFLLIAFFAFQTSGRNAEMRAIPTEMAMLSKRLSRGLTEAMQGGAEGVDTMGGEPIIVLIPAWNPWRKKQGFLSVNRKI